MIQKEILASQTIEIYQAEAPAIMETLNYPYSLNHTY